MRTQTPGCPPGEGGATRHGRRTSRTDEGRYCNDFGKITI